ncbi:MAG: class I SAM-dependent methyltransferase [Elusimicrobiota bacterium]
MPSVEENRLHWGRDFNWGRKGDEWSQPWGGVRMQWFGSIFPRIHSFLPAESILEIAPGFGRWTQFLKNHATKLTLVDLAPKCIEACRERFRDAQNISYYVNDGTSLDMVPPNSIDLIFSFDSLVHAEEDVLSAYVAQFADKLKRNGAAFIHHSNLGSYPARVRFNSRLRARPNLARMLRRFGMEDLIRQWRAPSMTARKMVSFCGNNGLKCISQELVNWDTKRTLIDCFSVVVKKDSVSDRENIVLENREFQKEVDYLSRLRKSYGMFGTESGAVAV